MLGICQPIKYMLATHFLLTTLSHKDRDLLNNKTAQVTECNFLRLCEINYSWTDLTTAWHPSRGQISSLLFLLAKGFWIAIDHIHIHVSSLIWCVQQEYLGKNTILVSSGYCNKAPWTKGLINNKKVFLIVLKTGTPGSGHQHVGYGEDPLLGCRLLTHSCVLTWQKEREGSISLTLKRH